MKVHAYQKFRIMVLGLTQRFSFYPDSSVTLKWYTFSQGRKERYQYSQIYPEVMLFILWHFLTVPELSWIFQTSIIMSYHDKNRKTINLRVNIVPVIALRDPSVSGLSRPTFFTPALCADNDP